VVLVPEVFCLKVVKKAPGKRDRKKTPGNPGAYERNKISRRK